MLITWIVLGGIAIAMYIIIYKYEKKMNEMQELIEANKDKIGEHQNRINKNHEISTDNRDKLEEHDDRIISNQERSEKNHDISKKNRDRIEEHNNHINQMWVTIPKHKATKED